MIYDKLALAIRRSLNFNPKIKGGFSQAIRNSQ